MDFRWILVWQFDFKSICLGNNEKYVMALSYILVAPEQKLTKVDVESPPCISWLRCRNGKITTLPGGVPQFQVGTCILVHIVYSKHQLPHCLPIVTTVHLIISNEKNNLAI